MARWWSSLPLPDRPRSLMRCLGCRVKTVYAVAAGQVAALLALDRPPEAAVLAQVVRQLQQLRTHLEQEEARFADSESHVLACSATPWVQLAQLTATVNTLPGALEEVDVRPARGVSRRLWYGTNLVLNALFMPWTRACDWATAVRWYRTSCKSCKPPMTVRA